MIAVFFLFKRCIHETVVIAVASNQRLIVRVFVSIILGITLLTFLVIDVQ